jgi:hypothetical protein
MAAQREEQARLMEERRKQMQARIDQAIEAMGERRAAPPPRFRPTPPGYGPYGSGPYGSGPYGAGPYGPPAGYYGQPNMPAPAYRWGPGY